jgi:hypothetical protein
MSEWGCVWTSLNRDAGDQGQVTEHPLSDWRAFDSYEFPDPSAPERFADAGERIGVLRQSGKFVVGVIGKGPMHLLDDLRGFEAYLVDLVSAPDRRASTFNPSCRPLSWTPSTQKSRPSFAGLRRRKAA